MFPWHDHKIRVFKQIKGRKRRERRVQWLIAPKDSPTVRQGIPICSPHSATIFLLPFCFRACKFCHGSHEKPRGKRYSQPSQIFTKMRRIWWITKCKNGERNTLWLNEFQRTKEGEREKESGRNTIILHNHQRLNYSKAMVGRTLKGRRAVDWLRV